MNVSDASPVRKIRLWVLLAMAAVILVWFGGIAIARSKGEDHAQMQFMVATGVSMACGSAILFLAPLLIRMSVTSLAVTYGVLFLALGALFLDFRMHRALLGWRVVGVTGDLYPRFVSRWKADAALPSAHTIGAVRIELPEPSENDFTQFLGSNRDATISNVQLARDWTANPPKVKWRQPIGEGWSAFAIVGDYAFTQEQQGENECVVCYEVATGRAVWKHADFGRFESVIGGIGPRSTPTFHQGKLYTYSPLARLNCIDAATGECLWTRAVAQDIGFTIPDWGKSCSPLIVGDLVVVSAGNPQGGALAAYRISDGELAWRAGDDDTSYSSPMLATLAGREQIVIINHDSVTGHEPGDGKVLWNYNWPGDNPKVAQPIPFGPDRLLVGAGYGLGSVMLNITEQGGAFAVSEAWSAKTMKPKFANMVVRDGFIYGFDDGVLGCVSVADGKRKWRKGRYGHGQLLLVGDLILLISESGELALVEANPNEFVELAKLPVFEAKTWNPPALAGKTLLIRNDQEAACIELP